MNDNRRTNVLLLISFITLGLIIFPELTESIRVCTLLTLSWAAVTIRTTLYRVTELLSRRILVFLFAVGIVALLVLQRFLREKESGIVSGRYPLQMRVGRGWKTIREFDHPVEQTCLNGYPMGTYRLMQLGADGRFQKQIWCMRWHGRISSGLRIYGDQHSDDERVR